MKVGPTNQFSAKTRVEPQTANLRGVRLEQGSQVLRVPPGSRISNVTLRGGASFESKWAVLRGAVLKFDPKREQPIIINGQGFAVPSGHTLMDQPCFVFTVNIKNAGREIPHLVVDRLSSERLYLVHASYCHPDQLFLPQGKYTETAFSPDTPPEVGHLWVKDGVLYLREADIAGQGSFNILAEIPQAPPRIVIQLLEGGCLTLTSPQA